MNKTSNVPADTPAAVSAETVTSVLAALGIDPTADRIEQITARLDLQGLQADDRDALKEAVLTLNQEIAGVTVETPGRAHPLHTEKPFVHVAYHGTRSAEAFATFRPSLTGAQGPGIYLADSFSAASEYGGAAVVQAVVTLSNPYYFFPSDDSLDAEVNGELLEQVLDPATLARVSDRMLVEGINGYGFEVRDALAQRGHDGIIMVYPFGEPALAGVSGAAVIVAFDPGQVEIKHYGLAADPLWGDWLSAAGLARSVVTAGVPQPFREATCPLQLSDPTAIAEYVAELSPYEVSEEQIEEMFRGCVASLRWRPLGSLILENEDYHLSDPERQRACDSGAPETMPPLLVEDNVLQDGYHRLRALRSRGATHYWAYEIEAAPERDNQFVNATAAQATLSPGPEI